MSLTDRIEAVARVCHEANRAYCLTLGDHSQVPWDAAPEWQRKSCIDGVSFRLLNPSAGPEASHENWSKMKISEGWIFGDVKDVEKKTHPCLVPFDQLPPEQQAKDRLFLSIVKALNG